MTEQALATLEDRKNEIGPVREDSRGLLSLWAIYTDEEIRTWVMMMLGRSRRMRKINIYRGLPFLAVYGGL